MKKFTVLSGTIAAALAIMVSACTSGAEKPTGYDKQLLNIDNVNKISQIACKTVNMTDLRNTLHYVENTSGSKARDILRESPEGTTQEALQQALSGKITLCENEAKNTVQTVAEDGTGWQLPMAPENVDILVGDSTKDPDTPPVMSMPALPEKCRTAINWTQVRDCAGTEQWYVDGINLMKPFSGYNWADVEKWADAKRVDGTPVGDTRLVQVFREGTKQNPRVSEADAKKGVSSLVGNDRALERMGVSYHDESFVNTRGLENERVSPFIDPSRQIRVSIAPLILNEKGEAVGLNPVGGIFVDCWNIWGKAYAIAPEPGKPALCPGTNMPIPPQGPKGCNPPGTSTPPTTSTTSTCPNCTPTTTPPVEIKDRRQGSNYQHQFEVGGKQEQTQGTVEPPPAVVTTPRVNPPPPPPPPPPAGTQTPPKPTDTGTPPPTNPGAGPSNSGTVAPPP